VPAGALTAREARQHNEGALGKPGFPRVPSVRTGTYDPAMSQTREAEELLLIEEADAWFEYLEATRGQIEPRYHEVEPWAWARLSQRLRAVRTKRAKLRPAAAA
jgi:hypothetical protein